MDPHECVHAHSRGTHLVEEQRLLESDRGEELGGGKGMGVVARGASRV
jgi:hypothetical protein